MVSRLTGVSVMSNYFEDQRIEEGIQMLLYCQAMVTRYVRFIKIVS